MANWIGGENPKLRRKIAWISLALAASASLALVIIPVTLIQPFRAQTVEGLRLSFSLRQWSPTSTFAASIVAIILVAYLWRGSRWWAKAIEVVALALVLVSAWFARQNHFEWMFK